MISEAMSIAFNRKNKEAKSRANLFYPNYQEFLNSFNMLINKNELLPNGSIRNSLDKYYNFCYGVIDYDFITQLEEKQKEYDLYLTTVKKLYDSDKKFIGYDKATINCKINFYTLRAASDLVKNFNNYISGPYFFMAIYKQNKDNKKIVRLFLHPDYFDNEHIVFVDSGYERKYAKNLLENKVPFIKPISDSCFYKINGKFVNYEKEDLKFTRASLQFLPDFIEFSENKINIVEVSGYYNVEYQNLMDRKIKHYENESLKSGGLYQVKVVNGVEI
jgi:DNA-dependent RNA polymerase auxiliary subunit epsilon